MIKVLSKSKDIQRLGRIVSNTPEITAAVVQMNSNLEKFRKEYRIKEYKSKVSAFKVNLV